MRIKYQWRNLLSTLNLCFSELKGTNFSGVRDIFFFFWIMDKSMRWLNLERDPG